MSLIMQHVLWGLHSLSVVKHYGQENSKLRLISSATLKPDSRVRAWHCRGCGSWVLGWHLRSQESTALHSTCAESPTDHVWPSQEPRSTYSMWWVPHGLLHTHSSFLLFLRGHSSSRKSLRRPHSRGHQAPSLWSPHVATFLHRLRNSQVTETLTPVYLLESPCD